MKNGQSYWVPKRRTKRKKKNEIRLWLLRTKGNSDVRRNKLIDENVNGKIPHKFAFDNECANTISL